MRFPWRRARPRPDHAPAAREAEGPYRSRYDIAREGYEMRVAQLARALDQASLKFYLAALANLVLGVGIVTIALRGGVRPVFIPYDQLGRVIRYEDVDRLREPPRAIVEAELARWLVNVRGIYYGDPVAQLDRARAARRLLSPAAEQWLNQYFAAPARNPVLLLREGSRTVELVSIARDPDRPLWYLQWREIEVGPRGPAVESIWQGTLKVELARPTTEDAVWENPAGIRILSIEWNRLRERSVAPRPGAPGPPAAPAPPPAGPDVGTRP